MKNKYILIVKDLFSYFYVQFSSQILTRFSVIILFAQNVELCADGNAAGSEVPHHPGEAGGGDPPGLAGRHPHPPHRGHQVRVQSATESEAQGQTQRGQGVPPPQQQ